MGYGLHIERRTSDGTKLPISLEEWLTAVEQTPGIRLADGPLQVVVPVAERVGLKPVLKGRIVEPSADRLANPAAATRHHGDPPLQPGPGS